MVFLNIFVGFLAFGVFFLGIICSRGGRAG